MVLVKILLTNPDIVGTEAEESSLMLDEEVYDSLSRDSPSVYTDDLLSKSQGILNEGVINNLCRDRVFAENISRIRKPSRRKCNLML